MRGLKLMLVLLGTILLSSICSGFEVISSSAVTGVYGTIVGEVKTIKLTCELCGKTTTYLSYNWLAVPDTISSTWIQPFSFMLVEWHKDCWSKFYKQLISEGRRSLGIKVKK